MWPQTLKQLLNTVVGNKLSFSSINKSSRGKAAIAHTQDTAKSMIMFTTIAINTENRMNASTVHNQC